MAGGEVTGIGYRCQYCGQPLDVTPETIVAVCKYCGRPNWLVGALGYPIVLVPGRSRGLDRIFYRYIESDPDMRRLREKVHLRSISLVYVPLYTIHAIASGSAWGEAEVHLTKLEVRTVNGKTETRIKHRTVSVTVSEEYSLSHDIDLVARRSYETRIVDPLVRYYRKKGRPYESLGRPLESVNWEEVKGDVLAAEIHPDEAKSYARDEACDRSYEIVKKALESKAKDRAVDLSPPGYVPVSVDWMVLRIPCKAEVTDMSPLVLLPMVEAVYTYEGKVYRTVFAGWDGSRVYGEEPMLAQQRLAMFGGGAVLSGLLSGGGLVTLLMSGLSGLERAIGALGVLAGMAASYYLARISLRDVRVEEVK
ncbi:MAG: hypothetical protein F7C34_02960 [Desulfurococcales archaeon]|nr:hypothetical protein [Desulfurococcales archaeon]